MFQENDNVKTFSEGVMGETAMADTKREPGAVRAINRQQSVIGELEVLCSHLEKGLRGVLQPESPTGESAGKATERVSVPLVNAIDTNTDHIHKVNHFLSNLLNRLEV